MKKVSVILLVIILLCVAYTGFWWYKSNYLKHFVVSALEKIKNERTNNFKIQHGEIVRQGFPLSVEVGIKNPEIEWLDNPTKISNEGMLTVGTGIFDTNKFWIKLSGDTHLVGEDNPDNLKESGQWLLSGDFLVSCHCGDQFVLDQKFAKEPIADLAEFIDNSFSKLTIEGNNLSLSDVTKEEESQLFDLNKASLYITKTKHDSDTNDFTIDLKVKEFVYYPEPNLPEELRNLFPGSDLKDFDLGVLVEPSTINSVLKMHGTIPSFDNPIYTNPSLLALPPFLIAIDKYEGTQENKFGDSSFMGDLYLEKKKDQTITSSYTFDTTGNVTEEHHKELLKLFDQVVDKAKENKEAKQNAYISFMIEHQDEIKQLIPDLSKFGTSSIQLDINAGALQKDSTFESLLVKLNQLNFITEPYELKINGELKENKTALYDAKFIITLKKYADLIENLVNYYNRWQELLAKSKIISPEQYPHIPDQVVNQTLQFMESISDTPQSPTDPLVITMTIENSTQIKIGTLALPEFLEAYGKFQAKVTSELYPHEPKK